MWTLPPREHGHTQLCTHNHVEAEHGTTVSTQPPGKDSWSTTDPTDACPPRLSGLHPAKSQGTGSTEGALRSLSTRGYSARVCGRSYRASTPTHKLMAPTQGRGVCEGPGE